MGIYLNPGNSGFEQICRGEYIDMTGLIGFVNQRIGGYQQTSPIWEILCGDDVVRVL